jgi:hypothetical protein
MSERIERMKQAKRQLAGSGEALPAGVFGEIIGTLRSGTGGSTYSNRSSTVPTTSFAALISVTLNKGIYIVSFQANGGSSVSTFFEGYVTVGGTQVTSITSNPTSGSAYGSITQTVPLLISADSTAVAFTARVGSGTGATNGHEVHVLRIA